MILQKVSVMTRMSSLVKYPVLSSCVKITFCGSLRVLFWPLYCVSSEALWSTYFIYFRFIVAVVWTSPWEDGGGCGCVGISEGTGHETTAARTNQPAKEDVRGSTEAGRNGNSHAFHMCNLAPFPVCESWTKRPVKNAREKKNNNRIAISFLYFSYNLVRLHVYFSNLRHFIIIIIFFV